MPGALRASLQVGNVSCGQTLTESTTLENDLENCFADGLVAGADGITIDLNGHTIRSRLGLHQCENVLCVEAR